MTVADQPPAPTAAVDIRDAFFDHVYELARRDRNLIFLTDDMDAFSLRAFKRDLPAQFINIGVAEQNLVNVAAGLALGGKRVMAYGIVTFITSRCFEQIKLNLCSMRLPVALVGVGTGFSFGFDGPSHHGTQDLAIMRALPEITIYNPSDSALAARCADLAYQADGPVYIRLDKGTFPILTRPGEDGSEGFRVLRPLQDLNLVSTGFMTSEALRIAQALEPRGIRAGVVDLYRLKPVNPRFASTLLARSRRVVTLEDHAIVGGLGSLVSELIADAGASIALQRVAIRDEQFLRYGTRAWFHRLNGIDVESVVERLAAGGQG